ncbi:peptidylprolyl isomerase [Fundicoccus sp. Sow4_D5]|uniref:peptidylprolyl isomerase n=1 Tax=Fundicoccus sp. Sow4_D5 TaxID=3438782 RepID=UPI003F93CB5E
MKKTLLKVATSAAALTILLASPIQLTVLAQDEDIIATVGEQEITKEDFYQEMKAFYGNATLRTMLLETVLEQNVDNAEAILTGAQEEVNTQIEQAGGAEVFEQLLAYQQLGSVEDFTHQIYVSNMLQEVVAREVDTSDEAIQSYYDNEYAPTMEAQHILVETEDEAIAAIERINAGEEFDVVAQELSLDSSAANGGLLSPFTTGQMVPEFEEAVKSQAAGDVTQTPVQSQYGFHIIKTLNNGEKAPLDEIKEEVTNLYKESKFADSNFSYTIIGKLLEQANVQINDEDLKLAIQDLIDLANQPVEAEDTEETTEETPEEEVTEEEETESTEDAE